MASIYCNGYSWNATLKSCSRTDALPKLLCNFEENENCGWRQPMENNSWVIVQNALKFDSNNLKVHSKSAIFSPTYSGDYIKNSCLSIMFKQHGNNMGTFNVFIVPENEEDLSQPLITFEGNKGPEWNLWTVSLKDAQIQGPFQIVLEVVRGESYLSNIYVNYVEIMTDAARCQWLIQTSKVVDHPNDKVSPESCRNRCDKNISRPYWNRGSCDCDGATNLCYDVEICNNYEAPQFFKNLGLSTWSSQVIFLSCTTVSFVALISITVTLWYKRAWSSVIPQMISEQDIYGRLSGTRSARYIANNLDNDSEDFINFELNSNSVEESSPEIDFIMEHQYAAIQEFHRYEEPPE